MLLNFFFQNSSVHNQFIFSLRIVNKNSKPIKFYTL